MESALCRPVPDGTRLIETFRYDPASGFHDLARHLRRMERSARELGFPFDRPATERRLARFGAATARRCRLTLSLGGETEFTTADLAMPSGNWVVAIADHRLRSDDPWLRHKTTRRPVYDAARQAMPDGVDELLFLNERGELCEGTITNLFVRRRDGARVTPPLTSGCLPGVLRQRLLDSGQVREQVVTPRDLRDAQAIHVGNSLRGEIAVNVRGLADGGATR